MYDNLMKLVHMLGNNYPVHIQQTDSNNGIVFLST